MASQSGLFTLQGPGWVHACHLSSNDIHLARQLFLHTMHHPDVPLGRTGIIGAGGQMAKENT